jgi:hypothetical protein
VPLVVHIAERLPSTRSAHLGDMAHNFGNLCGKIGDPCAFTEISLAQIPYKLSKNDHFEEKLIVYLTLNSILRHTQHLVQAMV